MSKKHSIRREYLKAKQAEEILQPQFSKIVRLQENDIRTVANYDPPVMMKGIEGGLLVSKSEKQFLLTPYARDRITPIIGRANEPEGWNFQLLQKPSAIAEMIVLFQGAYPRDYIVFGNDLGRVSIFNSKWFQERLGLTLLDLDMDHLMRCNSPITFLKTLENNLIVGNPDKISVVDMEVLANNDDYEIFEDSDEFMGNIYLLDEVKELLPWDIDFFIAADETCVNLLDFPYKEPAYQKKDYWLDELVKGTYQVKARILSKYKDYLVVVSEGISLINMKEWKEGEPDARIILDESPKHLQICSDFMAIATKNYIQMFELQSIVNGVQAVPMRVYETEDEIVSLNQAAGYLTIGTTGTSFIVDAFRK